MNDAPVHSSIAILTDHAPAGDARLRQGPVPPPPAMHHNPLAVDSLSFFPTRMPARPLWISLPRTGALR
jgi:hypothetical protein